MSQTCSWIHSKSLAIYPVRETAPESLFYGGPTFVLGLKYEQWFAYLEIQNALLVIRRVQIGSVRFRLFGISLNTAKMKYVI